MKHAATDSAVEDAVEECWSLGLLVAAALIAVAGFALYAFPGLPGSTNFPGRQLPWTPHATRELATVGSGFSMLEQTWYVALALVPFAVRRTRFMLLSRAGVGLWFLHLHAGGSEFPVFAVSGGALLLAWALGLYVRFRTGRAGGRRRPSRA